MSRTTECVPGHTDGRRRKMEVFAAAATTLELFDGPDDPDVSDALISMRVHAGIAAADVTCCARLGHHASGEDHTAAVELLAKVDRRLASHLRRLLGVKTKAQYSAMPVSNQDLVTSARASSALLDAARQS